MEPIPAIQKLLGTKPGGQNQTKPNRGQTGTKPGTDGTVPIFSAQCGNGTDSRDPEIAGSPAKFESFLIFSANGPLRSRRRGGRWASCYAAGERPASNSVGRRWPSGLSER